MTAPFGRLLYTDCRPGGGLGGGGGFQVQAKSPEVDPDQSRMAIALLTYSIPSSGFAGRPVEDYPEGFAHAADAGYGTAASRYLGAGVNDPRPGNHLADCLLTRDPVGYGPVRPAQLWGADLWNATSRPSTDYPALDGELRAGPLTGGALAAWLAEDPRRAPLLERLLSVLEQPQGPQVQLRSATAEGALRWIAAATVLLPVEAALAVSFRVFNSSRNDARFRVLGLHADTMPALTPGSRPGSFLLDDVTAIADEVPVSVRAAEWVGRFVRAEDAEDVIEAVQLAAALEAGLADPEQRRDARAAAWSVSSLDAGPPDAGALARWLAVADDRAIAEHGDAVAQVVVDAEDASTADLAALNRLMASGRLTRDPQLVRMRLIQAEIRDAQDGRTPLGPAEPLSMMPEQNEQARRALSSAMIAADDRTMARLLAVVGRHRIAMHPASPAYRDRLARFVSAWIAAPRSFDHQSWGGLDESLLLDELRDQLRAAAAAEPARYDEAVTRFAPLLVDGQEAADDDLAWDAEANATRAMDAVDRRRRVQDVLAGRRIAVEGVHRAERLARYQSALVRRQALEGDEDALLEVVSGIPAAVAVHPLLLRGALDAVQRRVAAPDLLTLKAAKALAARSAVEGGWAVPRPVLGLARAGDAVDGVLDALAAAEPAAAGRDLVAVVPRLRDVPPTVLAPHLPALRAAAVGTSTPIPGTMLLRALPEEQGARLVDGLARTLSGRPDPVVLHHLAAWTHDAHTGERVRTAIVDRLAEVLQGIPEAQRAELLDRSAPREEEYWAADWASLREVLDPPARRGWWSRRRSP